MKRKPLRRTALRRSRSIRRASPKRRLDVDLDRVARLACIMAAGGVCERCAGFGPLEWHHVVSRRVRSMRWLAINAVCLCVGCHRWYHARPRLAKAWFVKKYGDARWDELVRLRG